MDDAQNIWLQFPPYPLEFDVILADRKARDGNLNQAQQTFLQALNLISDPDAGMPSLAPWPRTLLHQLIKYQVQVPNQKPLRLFWTLLKVIHDGHGLPWYELFTAVMDLQTPDAIPKLIREIRQRQQAEGHEPAMVKTQNHQQLLQPYEAVLAERIP